MDWTPYGPHAALVRFADKTGDEAFARAVAIRAALERNPPEGLLEFVPAYTTVLLEFSAREVPNLDDAMPDILEQLQMAATLAMPPAPVKEAAHGVPASNPVKPSQTGFDAGSSSGPEQNS